MRKVFAREWLILVRIYLLIALSVPFIGIYSWGTKEVLVDGWVLVPLAWGFVATPWIYGALGLVRLTWWAAQTQMEAR